MDMNKSLWETGTVVQTFPYLCFNLWIWHECEMYIYLRFPKWHNLKKSLKWVKISLRMPYHNTGKKSIAFNSLSHVKLTTPTQTDSPVSSFSSSAYQYNGKVHKEWRNPTSHPQACIPTSNTYSRYTLLHTHQTKDSTEKSVCIRHRVKQMALYRKYTERHSVNMYWIYVAAPYAFEGLLWRLAGCLVGTHTFMYWETDAFLHKSL